MLKKKVQITLSDESRQALEHFDEDVKVLVDLVQDLATTSGEIKLMIEADSLQQAMEQEEIAAEEVAEESVGVEVFESASPNGEPLTPPWQGEDLVSHDPTIRSTPFTRAPRQVQVDWLCEVMANGEWFAANTIARNYATDERHHRYMKGALTQRLREMWEEGLVERRDSHVRGSMFEYRLTKKIP